MLSDLAIILGNVRFTGMQYAALKARVASWDHREAADRLEMNYSSFRWRHASAMRRMPETVLKRYRAALPRRAGRRTVVRLLSLSGIEA